MTWDLFICHASEDKVDVARPLADMLQAKGFKVWYDEYTLTLGDNLRRSIEQGLAQSPFGVVILSPFFFAKKWTNLELDGLFSLEKDNEKRILPVWHNVTAGDVERYSSIMAMRLGVPTNKGLDNVVQKIELAITRERTRAPLDPPSPASIHPRAIEFLIAARDADGSISSFWHLGGLEVTISGRSFGPENDPRTIALNLHCLTELVMFGLAEWLGKSSMALTQEGFDYEIPQGVIQASTLPLPEITPANVQLAEEIMQSAVAGNARVMLSGHLSGHSLQAGSQQWETGIDRRIVARWKSVLKELAQKGLLLPRSPEISIVTHLGFLWTDAVNARERLR